MAGSDPSTTLNVSGQHGASPREYDLHMRHRNFARLRHAAQRLAFLQRIATKLGTTTAVVFAKLEKYPEPRVAAATSLSQLP